MDSNRLDTNSTKSELRGFPGLIETLLRRFRNVTFLILLAPIIIVCILCMGIALSPSVILFNWVSKHTNELQTWFGSFLIGLSLAAGFFLYGFTLIFVVPLANKLFPYKVKPQRATWYSLSVIPWYYHNALTYLVRYTFLDFITPTPINKFYFRMMGMKVGKGGIINTSNISDPCLIEIGDNVTIGGSATLIAHYGMKGMLIIDKLVIHDDVTIGLSACLFGNVVIGENVLVGPHEVVLPKSRIMKTTRNPEKNSNINKTSPLTRNE